MTHNPYSPGDSSEFDDLFDNDSPTTPAAPTPEEEPVGLPGGTPPVAPVRPKRPTPQQPEPLPSKTNDSGLPVTTPPLPATPEPAPEKTVEPEAEPPFIPEPVIPNIPKKQDAIKYEDEDDSPTFQEAVKEEKNSRRNKLRKIAKGKKQKVKKPTEEEPLHIKTGKTPLKVRIFRYVIWALIFIVGATGIKNIIAPVKVEIPKITQSVSQKLGINGFPLEEGKGFAQRFATAYLTYTGSNDTSRRTMLTKYLPADQGGANDGWLATNISDKPQVIVSGPYLSGNPELLDETCDTSIAPCHATFTFAAQVTNPSAAKTTSRGEPIIPSWVFLSVPIVATDTGVAVASAPGFAPAPFQSKTGAPIFIQEDSEASTSIVTDLTAYFTAWAASSSNIHRYTIPDESSQTAIAGLGGTVKFVNLEKVTVSTIPSAETNPTDAEKGIRDAIAWVTWTQGSNTYQQQYRLKVAQADDTKWYVLDIESGGFNPR